jgi:SAM-dependent methyltransferase
VAVDFDYFTRRISTPMAIRMIDLARLQPQDRVLDIGTGTGLVALRAASHVAHGLVIGIDHSPGMLKQARANAGRCGVSFRRMDAEHLRFPDHYFDVVLSLYALLHFPEPLAALREMYRVLRPGGRVVIGVGKGASLLSWDGVVQGVRRVRDLIAAARGRLLTAPEFLHQMMREHELKPDLDQQPHPALPIGRMLREVGFRDVRRCWLGCSEQLNADDFWRLQVTFDSRARTRLQKASPQELVALEQDFLKQCRNVQKKNGALTYRYAAMFYTGACV